MIDFCSIRQSILNEKVVVEVLMITITIEIRVMIVDEVSKVIAVIVAVEEEEEMADFQIVEINKETMVVMNDEMTEVVHVVR